MTDPILRVEVAERIATLTVNRPDKLNALNDAVIRALGAAIDECIAREDVAAVILTGAGRAFVAGADIAELHQASPVEAQRISVLGQQVFRRFETSPKPTIAAVNGFALGGGCELAMACHIRLASETAKFGQPEVKLGLGPGYGGTQRLPRLVGKGRALELLLGAGMIDAAEAYRIGLVNRVLPAGDLLDAARQLAATFAAQAPLALAAIIEAVDVGAEHGLVAGLAVEAQQFGVLTASEDMREGTTAFLEKRPAIFRGR
jgi:enoyl-CoA hydratase